jgi:hypothetical protein
MSAALIGARPAAPELDAEGALPSLPPATTTETCRASLRARGTPVDTCGKDTPAARTGPPFERMRACLRARSCRGRHRPRRCDLGSARRTFSRVVARAPIGMLLGMFRLSASSEADCRDEDRGCQMARVARGRTPAAYGIGRHPDAAWPRARGTRNDVVSTCPQWTVHLCRSTATPDSSFQSLSWEIADCGALYLCKQILNRTL